MTCWVCICSEDSIRLFWNCFQKIFISKVNNWCHKRQISLYLHYSLLTRTLLQQLLGNINQNHFLAIHENLKATYLVQKSKTHPIDMVTQVKQFFLFLVSKINHRHLYCSRCGSYSLMLADKFTTTKNRTRHIAVKECVGLSNEFDFFLCIPNERTWTVFDIENVFFLPTKKLVRN